MGGETFTEDGRIDTFTVPTSGAYVITAIGATGGGLGPGYAGGAGAEVEGTFTLNAGDVLYILVGGAGTSNAGGNPDGAGSGGGGSFVYDETTGTLLEAAGGGGGASAGSGGTGSAGGPGMPGLITMSGSAGANYVNGYGVSYGGVGGTDGSGGGVGTLTDGAAGSGSGGGGGGYDSAGGNGEFGLGGASFMAGGAGGSGANLNNALNGGFGGGGGAASGGIGGGGGGGYSGGGGGEEDIGGGGGSYVASFATDISGFGGENADGNGSVTIMPCFLAGTRIATVRGDVAVEDMRLGDRVLLAAGERRPVCWIGTRSVDPARHPKPQLVLPVRVQRDAFGPGLPHRDLFLSPDHAIFVEGVLIPVQYLINGTMIRQMPAFGIVTYFHIELDRHDVLLADGLAVESYLETGNRSAFEAGGASMLLHPDFATLAREAKGCAPLVVAGPELEGARRLCAPCRRAAEDGAVRRPG